jgi:hypothetical protein
MPQSMSNTQTQRALVVAYVFPPSGGAGVQRVTKFVRYLPEFGWDCSVLTVANPSVPVFDESLKGEVPESTIVRKARTLEPGYAFKNSVSAASTSTTSQRRSLAQVIKKLVRSTGNAVLQPDAQMLWYPHAVKEGMRLLGELHHDAIFVTAPPFSSFIIGSELSRRSGLPLVLDYRDEWGISNQYQENRQKSRLSHWLQGRMQRRVLRQASAVIATTRLSSEAVGEAACRAGSRASISHIYNGYDANDFEVTGDDLVPRNDRLRLAYVGTLWNLTSIEPVVEAMKQVAATHPELAAKIELVVAGRRTGEQDAILDQLDGTPCRVEREGYVDHHRAISIMRSADALCLLLSDLPDAGRVVPAKTFEYLALRQPILSIAPCGEVGELLSNCLLAKSFEPSNVAGIAEWMMQRLKARSIALAPGNVACDPLSPSGEEGTNPNNWDVKQFERRELTRQLADVLDSTAVRTPINVVVDQPAKNESCELSGVGV